MPIAEAIGAGLQFVGDMVNTGLQQKNRQEDREWQLADRDHQEEYNEKWWNKQNAYNEKQQLDWWNRTNDYNIPAHQMERLRQAGINPALAYGNANAVAQAKSPSMMQAGTPKGVGLGAYPSQPLIMQHMGDYLSSYFSLSKQQSESELARYQAMNAKNLYFETWGNVGTSDDEYDLDNWDHGYNWYKKASAKEKFRQTLYQSGIWRNRYNTSEMFGDYSNVPFYGRWANTLYQANKDKVDRALSNFLDFATQPKNWFKGLFNKKETPYNYGQFAQ